MTDMMAVPHVINLERLFARGRQDEALYESAFTDRCLAFHFDTSGFALLFGKRGTTMRVK